MDNLRPKLSKQSFFQDCKEIVLKPSTAVQKLGEKLGIQVEDTVGRPDELMTEDAVDRLYSGIMVNSAEKVSKEEAAIQAQKKSEEDKIKRLQELPQDKVLEKCIEQKVLEMKK
eukprot:10876354-Karenia_brevis.AAC.1